MAAAASRLVAAALSLIATSCASVAADARAFEGAAWTVTAVNGQPAPAGFEFRFAAGKLSGYLGCNRFSGPYRVTGELLVTPALAVTRMACDVVGDGPAISPMTFEASGLAVLGRPMTMRWTNGRQLTLSNAAGSIALERSERPPANR